MSEASSSLCCLRPGVLAVNVGLASVDAIIALLSFYQLIRIQSRNLQLGWTRQKADDEDYEEEDFSFHEPLLELSLEHGESRRSCLPFRSIRVGSRQRVVILVIILAFLSTLICAALLWIDKSNNITHSSILAVVYQDIFDAVMLVLGGTLACYGLILCLKMRRVRSERAASDIWKVAGLAVVAVICFTSSAIVSFLSNIPVLYNWHNLDGNCLLTSVLLILYFFIGSSVPSAVLLWIMRDLPPPLVSSVPEESTTITFVRDDNAGVIHNPQRWTTPASSPNQRGEKQRPLLSEESRQRISGSRSSSSSGNKSDNRFLD